MSLNRTPKRTMKVVEVLTDPNPQFISLVDHGANQTPFSVLKRDGEPNPTPPIHMLKKADPANPASVKKDDTAAADAATSALVTIDSAALVVVKADIDTHQIQFRKAEFAEEALVKKFLDDNGYEGYEIVDKGDEGFVVDGIAAESFEKVEKIELANGVTFHVGKLKLSDSDIATAALVKATGEAVAPLQECTKKYDSWIATNATTLAQAIADMSQDGRPPGFYHVMSAFENACANAIRTGQPSLIAPLCTELGNALGSLATMFSSISKVDTVAAETLLAAPAAPAAPTQEQQQKADETPPAAQVVGMSKADVEALVAEKIAEVLTKMDTRFAEAAQEVVAKSDAAAADVKKSIAEHDQRLARVERVRQVRKSDDSPAGGKQSPSGAPGEGTPPEPAPAGKQHIVTKSEANLLGLRETPPAVQRSKG